MSIEAHVLRKRFGGVTAVDGVSINVDKGQIVGLIGPNGAGKTTTFNLLTGQLRPTGGEVRVDGEIVTGKPPWELSRRGIARTFQHAASFAALSVEENLRIALASHGSIPHRQRPARIDELLESVAPDAPRYGILKEQSYGVQRRVGIAIALANRPDYILMDEPAAGLNPMETSSLGDLVFEIAGSGIGVLLVEHDLELVGRVVSHLHVMSAGVPIFEGTPVDAMNDPAVLEAYIGTRRRTGA